MATKKYKPVIGLDIGSSALKMVVLKPVGKQFELVNFGILPFSGKAVSEGSIADRDTIVSGIKNLLDSEKIKLKEAVAAISGPSVIVKRIFVPRMSENELAETIQLEAEQYVPFPIDEVNLDFSLIEEESKATDAEQDRMEVLLVAAKRDKVLDYADVVREAGLIPKVIDVDAFALCNVYQYCEEQRRAQLPKQKKQKKPKKKRRKGKGEEPEAEVEEVSPEPQQGEPIVALVDIGSEMVNVNIVKDFVPVFTRDIPTGGKKIAESIQKGCHVNEEEAEILKFGGQVQDVTQDQVIGWVQDAVLAIAEELRRTFEFFASNHGGQQVHHIILSGGCATIHGLDEYLSDELEMSVDIANPFAGMKINHKVFDEEFLHAMAPVAVVGVGLALRGANER